MMANVVSAVIARARSDCNASNSFSLQTGASADNVRLGRHNAYESVLIRHESLSGDAYGATYD